MKIKILIITILISTLSFTANSQKVSPLTLKGTWKLQNSDIFERWDVLNENSMLGISYEIKNDNIKINEYIAISISENEIVYSATVVGQNNGETISFKLIEQTENNLLFENTEHDFPNKISYLFLDKTNLEITVSGKNGKSFKLKMQKQ